MVVSSEIMVSANGCSKTIEMKMFVSSGTTRCLQILVENLRRIAFTNSFYFVTDSSFTADGGQL